MQNLKWYLENIQTNAVSGHKTTADNLLHELFSVKYQKYKGSQIPKFVHPDVNAIYHRTYRGKTKDKQFSFSKLLDHNEFFSFFLNSIWCNILKAKPFEFKNEQIKSWIVTRCISDILAELKTNYDFITVSESPKNDIEISMKAYHDLTNESSYTAFLNDKGGLRKILGKQDAEIIEFCFNKDYIGINQIQIAEKLNIEPKLVSKRYRKAIKKLEVEYRTWKQLSALKGSDTYYTIYNFLKFFDRATDSDSQSNFDYFNFFIGFLKDEYRKGEQFISCKNLHQNKKQITYTVFDVITDGLKDRKIWELLYNYLEFDKTAITPSQKDKIVILGVKTLREFIKSSNRIIHKANKAAAEWYDEDIKIKNENQLKKYYDFAKNTEVITYNTQKSGDFD